MGHPFFSYKGILGNMLAFKKYVRMAFWHSKFMSDPQKLFSEDAEATRAKRIAISVEQIAEGKALHWKYERQ